MFEKLNKKSGIPTAVDITNASFRILGKGIGAVAKAGYNALAAKNNEQFRKSALDDIHAVVFPGAVLKPGHLLPPLRTANLTPDEVKKFTKACNGLIGRGIALPGYVTSFASRFYIELKK